MNDNDLRADLEDALRRSTKIRTCSLCDFIRSVEDETTRRALTSAAAGTLGRDSLVNLLRKHGTGLGNRTVERHRNEGHTPS